MKEIEQILDLWAQLETVSEEAVLATVVKTRGSSYRLPGARLLLARDGRRAGSVSGGCLEEDLVKRAWWLTESGPVIRRYDTTPEGEIASKYGLGCHGVIHVRLERVTRDAPGILDLIRRVRSERRSEAVTHVIEGSETFGEVLSPPMHLLIFGAGDDAIAMLKLAKALGWRVSVFDGRAHYARREKFREADCVTVCNPENFRDVVPIDEWTAAILMTHSFSQDREFLRALYTHRLPYLGVLGPRKRTDQLLAEAGIDPLNMNANFHAPMGLDIGADGPEQVALSVIAEIQAVLNAREGGFLSDRAGTIHSEEPEAAWVQSIVCA